MNNTSTIETSSLNPSPLRPAMIPVNHAENPHKYSRPECGKSATTETFTALNGLRFIAALAVVFYHYAPNIAGYSRVPGVFRDIISDGPLAVPFFFILSGFVLGFKHVGSHNALSNLGRFYWSRFARIYPVYLIAFVLFAPIAIQKYLSEPLVLEGTHYFLASAALYIVMLQAWTPFAQAWNGPAWSVSVEAFMYAVFPWTAAWLMKLSKFATAVVAFTAWMIPVGVAAAYVGHAIPGPMWRNYLTNNPLLGLPLFVLGICTAKCLPGWKKVPSVYANWVAMASSVSALIVVAVWPSSSREILISGGIAPLLALVILSFTSTSGWLTKAVGSSLMNRLGEASYVIYIVQSPIWHYWQALTNRLRAIPERASVVAPWQFMLFIPCLILVSLGIQRLLETPIRNWLMGMRKPAVPKPVPSAEG